MRVRDNELASINQGKYTMFGLGPPLQMLKVGKATAVVIPYKAIVENTDGKIQTDSSLVAVALDGGTWSVFDGSGHNARSLKVIIPGYTSGLNVPLAKSIALKTE